MDTINIIILAIYGIFGIVGAINGLSKGLVRSAIKVASVMLAIFVAFVLTPTLLAKAYEIASPRLDDAMASYGELFVASPTLQEYFPTLAMSLVAPIVFVVVFLLCLLVVSIIRAIINAILKAILPKKPGPIGRLGGFVFGLVAGVLVALCFVFPVTGYFTAVPNIYANVREVVSTQEQPIDPELEQIIINLPNVQGAQITNDITMPYFEQLTSYTDDETQVSALQELTTITSLVPPVLRFTNSVGNIQTIDTQALKDINKIIGSNKNLRTITAEIVSTASTKWMANEAFMGFNLKAQLDEEYASALDLVLADLAVTTESTVMYDLNTLAQALETVKHIYAYSNLLNSDTATMAELDAKLTDVLLSLTDDTVDLVHELISDDVMTDIGVTNPEVVADLVADVISSAVNNFNDAQTARDASAINSIMHFAAGDGAVTAQDVVDDIVHSPAIVQAIADAVNVDNPPVITVLPENKILIAEALLEMDDQQLAQNLKTLFGIK